MPPRPRSLPSRRLVVLMTAALVVVLLLLSPRFGRADPGAGYRPDLPPDALVNGCWPLPGDARLDFGYQVRRDDVVPTDDGPRRVLVLHYDEISGQEAARRALAALTAAGATQVEVETTDFVDRAPDAVVRGEMVLELPPSLPERRPTCRSPFSTKQFTPDMDDRS